MMHFPWRFEPQATAWPSLLRSTVLLSPAETWLYEIPSSEGGMLHCPSVLLPQATAWPSLLRSTVCHPPAETWQYESLLSKGGMLHCPLKFEPQATAWPSFLRSTVCSPPADGIVSWLTEGVLAPLGFELKVHTTSSEHLLPKRKIHRTCSCWDHFMTVVLLLISPLKFQKKNYCLRLNAWMSLVPIRWLCNNTLCCLSFSAMAGSWTHCAGESSWV